MSVKFHLPGLRANFPLNMVLVKMMQAYPEYFREGLEIASFFGEFPTSKWNGGRYNFGDQCSAEYIRHVIQAVNAEGIPIRFTYTNPSITEEDLSDPYCNFCLRESMTSCDVRRSNISYFNFNLFIIEQRNNPTNRTLEFNI